MLTGLCTESRNLERRKNESSLELRVILKENYKKEKRLQTEERERFELKADHKFRSRSRHISRCDSIQVQPNL